VGGLPSWWLSWLAAESSDEQGGDQSRAGPSLDCDDGMADMATGGAIDAHTENAELPKDPYS
jgi:hypothetical protein